MPSKFLLLLVCASIALAGCTGGDDDDGAPTPGTTGTPAPTTGGTPAATTPAATTPATATPPTTPEGPAAFVPYDLEVDGFPAAVEAGRNFTFVLRASGGSPGTSDHIGAHFGNLSAPDAPANTTTYARACRHVDVATPVPGTFHVTCSVPSAGEWFFRGHVRSGAGNDSWGEELRLTVRPQWNATGNYTLDLTGVPTVVRAGENATMNLTISGPPALSNHFGAHFGANSTDAPSTTVYNMACSHQGVFTNVGTGNPYVVICVFETPGTYYLRGHLRLDEGLPPATTTNNYWSGEHVVLVL